MKNLIKFGTDGWRGITGFDFTAEKVKIISAGITRYLQGNSNPGFEKPVQRNPAKVVVGYDTRFLSERFAETAAGIFHNNGIDTTLSDDYITTPVLSSAVVKNKADLGIMITASHNPYFYNGYKIKSSFGGSATMDTIGKIEEEVNDIASNKSLLKEYTAENETGNNSGDNISSEDFTKDYKELVFGHIDISLIKKNLDFPVLIDPMFGAGQVLFKEILSGLSRSKIYSIHDSLNTSFGGINPEPIGDNLKDAIEGLKQNRCKIGLCIDGDGDRIGAIGENGNFVSSHHIFAIALDYLIKEKKLSGKVVKTVSTSSIIDRMCRKYDLELLIKPVGFKYINEEICNGDVIIGGEESGGLWTHGYIPERDGIVMGLLLLEIICKRGRSINEILKDIYNEYGFFLYKRADYEFENSKKKKLTELLTSGTPEILKAEGAKEPVIIDGYKYLFNDGSWIMVRPSGTESVVRIYAESDTTDKLDHLHGLGIKLLDSID